ncbi:hypothetical protein AKJ54_00700 [candidate division MSBL1 archaeon SCGC-AAA382K21]|uniref:Uncharacterized protein n=1 Tax=candidate division MSBL1 archaeon SCGC-AAA382K21 TaxID=1698283 RepID=A0A133VL22_9EURY|nr:hypothetical protein AKJ54_00700 [candidate division MSBL1 archaeon SCGC-AAA382K21]
MREEEKMSKILYEKTGKRLKTELENVGAVSLPESVFTINSFYGGKERGKCIQITTDSRGYEEFTKKEIQEIIDVLRRWVEDEK